jgi:hypothetical protein
MEEFGPNILLVVAERMHSILPLLRDADFFVSFACSSVILSFAFAAYKRTGRLAFLLFVIASAILIIEGVALYRYGSTRATMSVSERETFQAVCRVLVMLTGIMTTAATLLLIRYVCPSKRSEN